MQRLTKSDKATDEYTMQMRHYCKHIREHLGAIDKDTDLTEVTDWNQLSINEFDPDFDEEFHKIINYEGITQADSECDVHSLPGDADTSSIRGDNGNLYRARVKCRAVDHYESPSELILIILSTIHDCVSLNIWTDLLKPLPPI